MIYLPVRRVSVRPASHCPSAGSFFKLWGHRSRSDGTSLERGKRSISSWRIVANQCLFAFRGVESVNQKQPIKAHPPASSHPPLMPVHVLSLLRSTRVSMQ